MILLFSRLIVEPLLLCFTLIMTIFVVFKFLLAAMASLRKEMASMLGIKLILATNRKDHR
jgi:hypothetical protein